MLFAIDFVRAGSGGAKEYMESMISYLGKRQDIEYLLILNRDQPSNLSRSLSKNSVVICPFKNIVFVVLWQAFILPVILRRRNVQSLLITDASTTVFFKKQIVMHRDMLAFDSQLVSQYLKHRLYKKYVRLKMIKYLQIFNLWYASKALFSSLSSIAPWSSAAGGLFMFFSMLSSILFSTSFCIDACPALLMPSWIVM